MWNWEWQAPADYGRRFSVGILEVHHKTLKQWLEHRGKAEPDEGWVASILRCQRSAYDLLPPRCITVDQKYRWIDQEGRHRGINGEGETGAWELTRGGIAACWAMEHVAPGGEVILVGFDNIAAGIALPPDAAFAPVYQEHPGFWGMDGYKAGVSKEGNHDYIAELALMRGMAARLGLNLRFAGEVWG